MGARVVFSHNLAYFTGHAAPQYETVREQAKAILKRYDELFFQFGLLKKNILYTSCYMKNADDEKEYADEYFAWIDPENPPAGVTVTASPIQHSPAGDNALLEVALIVATDPDAKIRRLDVSRGSRLTIYDGMAYFTGHVYPKGEGLAEQTAGVLARYDELFEKFGLKKENIILANGFIKSIGDYKALAEPWGAYFKENGPAGVVVQAPPNQNTDFGPNLEVELAFFVAVGENPEIKRYDVVPGMSRLVVYNGLGYFIGHSAKPGLETLEEQTATVLARYDELFERFGLKKENLVMMNAYLRDISRIAEFDKALAPWRDAENPPAGAIVQAIPSGENNQLELQFIVAVDD